MTAYTGGPGCNASAVPEDNDERVSVAEKRRHSEIIGYTKFTKHLSMSGDVHVPDLVQLRYKCVYALVWTILSLLTSGR